MAGDGKRLLVLALAVLATWATVATATEAPLNAVSCLNQDLPAGGTLEFNGVFVRNDGIRRESEWREETGNGGVSPEQYMHVTFQLKKRLGAGRNAVAYAAKMINHNTAPASEVAVEVYVNQDISNADGWAKRTLRITPPQPTQPAAITVSDGSQAGSSLTVCGAEETMTVTQRAVGANDVPAGSDLLGRPLLNFACVHKNAKWGQRFLPFAVIPKKRMLGVAKEGLFSIVRKALGAQVGVGAGFDTATDVVLKPFADDADPEFYFISRLGFGVHPNVLRQYGSLLPETSDMYGAPKLYDRSTAGQSTVPNKCYWIVMELWGGSLEGYMTRDYPALPQQERAPVRNSLMAQVLNAVSFMSSQRIMHRDLKPDNFLVKVEGGQPVVKMMDFGLSVDLDGPGLPTKPVGLYNWQDAVRPPESRFGGLSKWPFGADPVWGLDIWGVGMIGVMFGAGETHLGVKYTSLVATGGKCYGDYIKPKVVAKLQTQSPPGSDSEFVDAIKPLMNPYYQLRASPEEVRPYFTGGMLEFNNHGQLGAGRGGDPMMVQLRNTLYPSVHEFESRDCVRAKIPFANCDGYQDEDRCAAGSRCPSAACVDGVCSQKVRLGAETLSCHDIINQGLRADVDAPADQQVPVACVEGEMGTPRSCAVVHYCLTECNTKKMWILDRVAPAGAASDQGAAGAAAEEEKEEESDSGFPASYSESDSGFPASYSESDSGFPSSDTGDSGDVSASNSVSGSVDGDVSDDGSYSLDSVSTGGVSVPLDPELRL